MIYARRFGFHLGRWERLAVDGFVFLTAISWAAASDGSPGGSHYFGVQLTYFGLPPWAPLVLRLTMAGFGVLALLLVVQGSVRQRRLPPAMMLLPAVTQFIWFVPGPEVPAFYEFVQSLHSVQYLLIAWSVHLHEPAAGNDFIPGWRQVLWQSGRWGAINLFGGLALFWFLPRALGRIGADPVLAIGVVSAGVQVHHFFVDGVIWGNPMSAWRLAALLVASSPSELAEKAAVSPGSVRAEVTLLAATMLFGVLAMALLGRRIPQRTYASARMAILLLGGFGLLLVLLPLGQQAPIFGLVLFLALIGLFKVMGRFEPPPTANGPSGGIGQEKTELGPSTHKRDV
jgi:hypothetical protein